MRLYLIDYENVNSAGLCGIGQLPAADRVILFYSHSANTLSFEIMDEMLSGKVMPERICIEQSGKNALDFQLATLLGCLIANHEADEYFIISKDSGFSAVAAFCKEHLKTKVQLRPSIKATLNGKAAAVSVRKRKTVIQIQPMNVSPVKPVKQKEHPAAAPDSGKLPDLSGVHSLIPNLSDDAAQQILDCLCQSQSKTEFHNALQQHFGNDDVKDYYCMMKPCFSAAGY